MIEFFLLVGIIEFFKEYWYVFVFVITAIITVVSITKKSNHTSYQQTTPNYKTPKYKDNPMTPEYRERQKAVCEKYGFTYLPEETMSPEMLEMVLGNERKWRDEQKHKRLLNLRERMNFDNMDGHEFEELCADILTANGYECNVTKGSGDHGADIIATLDGVSYAIQCKCFSQPVGNKAVQEAHAGKAYYNTMRAAVLTNSEFTPQAIEDAEKMNVELWDFEVLSDLINGV